MIGKRFIFLIILLITILSVYPQEDPKKLSFQEIDFHFPSPVILGIKEGIVLMYLEDHELPLITIEIVFKTGTQYEPKGKEGLASLTWELIKNGGTTTCSPEEVDRRLDTLGASIEMNYSTGFCRISVGILKRNFEKVWGLFTDMLLNPGFDEDRLKSLKEIKKENVLRRWDDPNRFGFIIFDRLIYGKDHPRNRFESEKSIDAITREDTRWFYETHIKNTEIIIAFSGDIEPVELEQQIKKDFKNWNVKKSPASHKPKLEKPVSKPGIYFYNRAGMTQAIILVGHLGIDHLDPYNAEINVLNTIYGSHEFNSRLTKEIRIKQGCAYTIYGSVRKGVDPGVFLNLCVTGNDKVGTVIGLMKKIMIDITTNAVAVEELETAIKNEQNSLVNLFDSYDTILWQKILYRILGYPVDYMETYTQRIKKLDEEKLLKIAKRTIKPKELIILVIGDKDSVFSQLKKLKGFGKLRIVYGT